MFYQRGFFGVLIYNACLSIVFFALGLVLGPPLSQTLGATVSSILLAVLTLLVRSRIAAYYAGEMWERSAPARRIAFNVLIPAFVGHFVIYLPLVAVGALSTSPAALLGLLADSLLVVLASWAGMLMGRRPEKAAA